MPKGPRPIGAEHRVSAGKSGIASRGALVDWPRDAHAQARRTESDRA